MKRIAYGLARSPLGRCLAAWSDAGILRFSFVSSPGGRREIARLKRERPGRILRRDDRRAARIVRAAFDLRPGRRRPKLALEGTEFQVKVWRALLATRPGEVISYGELARRAGYPGAARAVGTAMATNPIAVLVPCHRVVRGDGDLGEYGGGRKLKRALIERESGKRPGRSRRRSGPRAPFESR